VKFGALQVPVAVMVWLCVPSALPVNVGAEQTPVAVVVCWCVPRAEPVNAGALFVPAGVPPLMASDEPLSVCALG
jgi:hypothetical protein